MKMAAPFSRLSTKKSLYEKVMMPRAVTATDNEANEEICRKVADKCYIPATKRILDLVKRHEGRFRVSYSISGVALEQFEAWTPEVIELFQACAETGAVEFLADEADVGAQALQPVDKAAVDEHGGGSRHPELAREGDVGLHLLANGRIIKVAKEARGL